MSDVEDNDFMRYLYRGEEDEVIPLHATHISVHESVTVILRMEFCEHPNIVEVICHDKVERIQEGAFCNCYSLRRVIMPGVLVVGLSAFDNCYALTDVECGKLEMIGDGAFYRCTSLRSINLPSVEIVKEWAFYECIALTDATFGNEPERIEEAAFLKCTSLERITIPLKDGMIAADDNIFQGCEKLKHVDLVEGELHETVAALHLEEWRNDMNGEIDSINQILPNADAGYYDEDDDEDDDEDIQGEKAIAIRSWIRSVLDKIIAYKAEHRRLLDEDVASTLQRVVPQNIVMNSILPFLELPPHVFEVEDDEEEEISDDDDEEEEISDDDDEEEEEEEEEQRQHYISDDDEMEEEEQEEEQRQH